jgi:hypothetical protein
MSPEQIVAHFFGATFMTLAIAWMVGIACITPRAKPVNIEKRRVER